MFSMMLGAIAMACFTASLFFLRFWKETKDRFFLFFSISFVAEGTVRVVQVLVDHDNEQAPYIYLIRLFGFSVILYAIFDKNRRSKGTKQQ
jgi:hypothetical protein